MEFISEYSYEDDTFDQLLKTLQYVYPFILSITKQYTAQVAPIIKGLETVIPARSSHFEISHAFTRCYATRIILSELFGIPYWYGIPRVPGNDMLFRVISIGGAYGFPDHTFITISYNDAMYLVQSYYYGYTLGGKYGVIKLDKDAAAEFDRILRVYALLQGRRLSYEEQTQVREANIALSKFTGVDSRRHMGNKSAKTGRNSYQEDLSFGNSLAVFNHLQYKLSGIKMVMINNLVTIYQKLRIDLMYNFADAFTSEAHPLLARTGGQMNGLYIEELEHVFSKLTGVALPGQVQGIVTGPLVVGGCVVWPANALIEMDLPQTTIVFRDINNVLDKLILKANVKNVLVIMKYPMLETIISAPADKQDEKTKLVMDLRRKRLL